MDNSHYFKIGDVDILPYVLQGGIKWTENDVDSPQAGRTLDGLMHRGKVTTKVKIEVQCIPMKSEIAALIYDALDEEYVTVTTNIFPKNASKREQELSMYNSTRPAACLYISSDGEPMWDEIKFNLIER